MYGERRQVSGENKLWKGAGTNNDAHSANGTVEGSPSGDMVYQGSFKAALACRLVAQGS